MRKTKISALTLVAVAAGSALTACNPDDSSNASSSATASSSASDQGGSGSSGSAGSGTNGGAGAVPTGSGSGSGAGAGAGAGNQCRTADLAFSTSHGMGEGQLVINLKNQSQKTCTMQGYAGVDLKALKLKSSVSAKRTGSRTPLVTLKPGDQTDFLLSYPVNNTGGSGVTYDQLVVTPPNDTQHALVAASVNVPVTSNAGPDITIGAVGAYK
jgi:hypothetical protein